MQRAQLNKKLRKAGWIVETDGITWTVWRRANDDRPDAPRIRIRVGPWVDDDVAKAALTLAEGDPPLRAPCAAGEPR